MKTVSTGPIYPINPRPLGIQDPSASQGMCPESRTQKIQEMSDWTGHIPCNAPAGSPNTHNRNVQPVFSLLL